MRKTILSLLVLIIAVVMAVPAFAADTEDDLPPVFDDNRINNYDADAPVAVFGTDFESGRGLEIWMPNHDFAGSSQLALVVTPEEIAAVSETPEEAALIDATEDDGIRLYRLPDGDFQLWAISHAGEWYALTFNEVLGPNTGYTSAFMK
jgi:hypothetical protein